jgi:hypothetical protein
MRGLPDYMRALGRRLGQATALAQALARAHPKQPDWYLYAIGVVPSRQARGIGSMLLRSRPRRCDQAGLPAYLEATKPARVPLYRHLGPRPRNTTHDPRRAGHHCHVAPPRPSSLRLAPHGRQPRRHVRSEPVRSGTSGHRQPTTQRPVWVMFDSGLMCKPAPLVKRRSDSLETRLLSVSIRRSECANSTLT